MLNEEKKSVPSVTSDKKPPVKKWKDVEKGVLRSRRLVPKNWVKATEDLDLLTAYPISEGEHKVYLVGPAEGLSETLIQGYFPTTPSPYNDGRHTEPRKDLVQQPAGIPPVTIWHSKAWREFCGEFLPTYLKMLGYGSSTTTLVPESNTQFTSYTMLERFGKTHSLRITSQLAPALGEAHHILTASFSEESSLGDIEPGVLVKPGVAITTSTVRTPFINETLSKFILNNLNQTVGGFIRRQK